MKTRIKPAIGWGVKSTIYKYWHYLYGNFSYFKNELMEKHSIKRCKWRKVIKVVIIPMTEYRRLKRLENKLNK